MFDHHFGFPSLPSKWTLVDTKAVNEEMVKKVEEYISGAVAEQRGFFVITSAMTVEPLAKLPSTPNVPSLFGVGVT